MIFFSKLRFHVSLIFIINWVGLADSIQMFTINLRCLLLNRNALKCYANSVYNEN